MNKSILLASLRACVRVVPDVIPHLSIQTRRALAEPTEYKTYDFFRSAIIGLVNGVYYNNIGGIFIDTLANLISGQLRDAFMRAWADEGHFSELPEYLSGPLEAMILQQYGYVDQYYRDIVDARVDETPIGPLLVRAEMWANQYHSAYNDALRIITLVNGGKMQWHYGDADHCDTCYRLNGIVAYAREWDEVGVHPQSPPNTRLECGGWRCKCSLRPVTDRRRSPRAIERIREIVNK